MASYGLELFINRIIKLTFCFRDNQNCLLKSPNLLDWHQNLRDWPQPVCLVLSSYMITGSRLSRCPYLLHVLGIPFVFYLALISLRYCSSTLEILVILQGHLESNLLNLFANSTSTQTIFIPLILESIILPNLKLSNT